MVLSSKEQISLGFRLDLDRDAIHFVIIPCRSRVHLLDFFPSPLVSSDSQMKCFSLMPLSAPM